MYWLPNTVFLCFYRSFIWTIIVLLICQVNWALFIWHTLTCRTITWLNFLLLLVEWFMLSDWNWMTMPSPFFRWGCSVLSTCLDSVSLTPSFQSQIRHLVDLTHLSIRHNRLLRLPCELQRLPLKTLNTEGNRLQSPPQALTEKSLSATIAYLAALEVHLLRATHADVARVLLVFREVVCTS